jgi:L-asparaginase II
VRFRWERSGVTEARFEATVCAVDSTGSILFADGDVDEPFFYRSAIKPIQATASLEAGARLSPEQLALACASHSGFPVHVALVRSILEAHGLEESALRNPADWPLAEGAKDLLVARGVRAKRPIYHNCSGKHAAWLAASAAAGWPTETYLDPGHPLQRRVVSLVAEVTGIDPEPVGVDGCGAPVLRGSTRGLASIFAALTADDRFAAAAGAMHRFPSLVADADRGDGVLGRWWGGPVKGGAAGCIGMGRHGIGIAAKSWSGRSDVAVAATIVAAEHLGLLSTAMQDALHDVATPVLLGGGRPVGSLARD